MSPELTNTIVTSVIAVGVPTILGLMGVGIAYARKRLGLQQSQLEATVETNMRDKLQNTLITAVGMYARGNKTAAASYVITQAGDAMSHLNVSAADVSTLIVNKAAAWAGVANAGAANAATRVNND